MPKDARECAVREYAEQVTKDSHKVTDELFARVRAHFDQEEAVELFFLFPPRTAKIASTMPFKYNTKTTIQR